MTPHYLIDRFTPYSARPLWITLKTPYLKPKTTACWSTSTESLPSDSVTVNLKIIFNLNLR